MIERTSCAGCAHDLGGGQCSVSLEDECGAGGHEGWRPRTVFRDCAEAARYRDVYMDGVGIHVQQTDGGYMAKWEVPNGLV